MDAIIDKHVNQAKSFKKSYSLDNHNGGNKLLDKRQNLRESSIS